jgi:TIR domain
MVAEGQNPKIVVSYRRSDSAMAGRIFDRLVQHFGKTNLFIDIDNVPFGVDFRKHIDDALKTSDLLVAIIGHNWLGSKDGGAARIMNAADPVRVELETALRRDLLILPVLLDGASMPDPAELPETIRDLSYRNALEVESGRDFNVHIDRLIRAIEHALGIKAKVPEETASPYRHAEKVSPLISPAPPPKSGSRKPLLLGIAGLLIAAGIGAGVWFWLLSPRDETSAPEGFPPFCLELGKVLFHAETQFTSILGPDRGGIWTARIQLPDWNDCTVRDWTYQEKTTRYYSCELPPLKNLDEAGVLQNDLATYVKPCLGPDFVERRSRYSDQTTDVTYEWTQDKPIVRLRMSHYKDTGDYIMRLDVDAPPLPAKQ